MNHNKPGLLSQLQSFFNWEVTCECCGSRYNGNTPPEAEVKHSENKSANLPNKVEEFKDVLKDLTVEKVGDKLFEQIISPSAQKTNVKSGIRKKKNVKSDKDGRPKWNQQHDAQLRLYMDQYGADIDMVKEFFPSFEKSELRKRINKIWLNKEDELKRKMEPLIKNGLRLEEITKTLRITENSDVRNVYQKLVNFYQNDNKNIKHQFVEGILDVNREPDYNYDMNDSMLYKYDYQPNMSFDQSVSHFMTDMRGGLESNDDLQLEVQNFAENTANNPFVFNNDLFKNNIENKDFSSNLDMFQMGDNEISLAFFDQSNKPSSQKMIEDDKKFSDLHGYLAINGKEEDYDKDCDKISLDILPNISI